MKLTNTTKLKRIVCVLPKQAQHHQDDQGQEDQAEPAIRLVIPLPHEFVLFSPFSQSLAYSLRSFRQDLRPPMNPKIKTIMAMTSRM
jgi:hypothetical protein